MELMHIFVSPHFDDAILSCAATIASVVQEGGVACVVVVFAASPLPPFSDFALELHATWGCLDGTAERRREEELCANRVLGSRVTFLEFEDAIYRRGSEGDYLYRTPSMLFGPISSHDGSTARTVASRLSTNPGGCSAIYYVPLGIGGHVDHLICRAAGMILRDEMDYTVFGYEDMPYCLQPDIQAERANEQLFAARYIREVEPEAVAKKVEAALCYSSQIATLFGSAEEMEHILRQYSARHRATGELCSETYWYLDRRCSARHQPTDKT